MTQALINNLNIISDTTVNVADKMQRTDVISFDKIFETKTAGLNKNEINKNTIEEKQHKEEYEKKNKEEIGTTSNSSIDDQNSENNNESKVFFNSGVQHTEIKSKNAKKTEKEEENKIANEDEKNKALEELITQEAIAEEKTEDDNPITDEAPTMNKELNTLEDSTTIFLLQSQIQKNIKTTIENEQNDEDNRQSNQQSNVRTANTDNTALFKQFETRNTAEVIAKTVEQPAIKESLIQKKQNAKLSNSINENIIKELNIEAVNSETENMQNSGENFLQNQSPQEQAARIMIQGNIKYEDVATETAKINQIKPAVITPSKIIEQISKQLDGMFNNSKLNIVLNPEKLGKVNLQLINSKDGLLAQFSVTTQEARDLLIKGLDGLKESLLANGINIDSLSVKFEEGESEFKFDYTEQEGSQGGNKQQGNKKQKQNEQNFEQFLIDTEKENKV